MKFTKGGKSFPVGSFILRTNRRTWCKELEAQEEPNTNCIRATHPPILEDSLRMLMNKDSVIFFIKGNWQEENRDSENQFWIKRIGIEYETFFFFLVGNEKFAKNEKYIHLAMCSERVNLLKDWMWLRKIKKIVNYFLCWKEKFIHANAQKLNYWKMV